MSQDVASTVPHDGTKETQQAPEKATKEKCGIDYPKEEMLIVRPCLLAMCLGIRPAGKLLSQCLYYARKCPQDQATFTFRAALKDLSEDMCDEVSIKTLHDIAVPTLQLLGLLDMREQPGGNIYTLHLDRVRTALAAYIPKQKTQPAMEWVLLGYTQLEKFLIEVADIIDNPQLEKVLINKKNFQLQLEKVLIGARKISNCQRGRKPRMEAAGEPVFENTENKRYKRDYSKRVYSVSADAENATPSPVFSAESLASEETQPDQQQGAKAHPIATETPPQPSEIPVQKPAKRTKKKPATPPALPGRPDPADPWNVEKCLAWGNYFRGFAYPHSERSNSKSYQERAGAQSILLRGKTERQFVDLMCFMRGVTVELEPETNANKKADWWPDNQPAEVRHANEQWDKMSAEYKRKNSGLSLVPPAQPGGVVTPLPGYSDPAKEAAFAALQQQIREEDARKRQQRMAR